MASVRIDKILIISLFGEISNTNSRVYKIDRAFFAKTTFVSPNYDHASKTFKAPTHTEEQTRVKSYYLPVPAYSKNLSIKRLYSHLVFAFKLFSFLKKLSEKPDLVVCLMPTSSAAYLAGKYCRRNNIYYMVDVIDLWPDSLIPLSNNKKLLHFLVAPWRYLTRKAYKYANYISGESKAYAKAAHDINPQVPWSYTYLGVDVFEARNLIDRSKLEIQRSSDEIWLCYGGSLSNSYDFETILNALKIIHSHKIRYKMIFVGEGEKRQFIETFSRKNSLNIEVTGRLSYQDYLKCLSLCDIGFNSFIKGTKVVHSYKFNDYCAAGLYILNNLKGETAEMIDKYDVGLNFNSNDLAEKLLEVCKNWSLYCPKKQNIELLINNELDSRIIYNKMKEDILEAYNNFTTHV